MRTKLFNKITLALVILSISTTSLVGIFSYYKYKQTIKNESYAKLELLIKTHGQDLNKQILFIEKYSTMMESVLRESFKWDYTASDKKIEDYEQKIIPLLSLMANDFRPLSYWIIFNPEYVKGGHTISYIDKQGDGNFVREKEYDVNEFDLQSKEMQWWVDAIKYGETWTSPYLWPNWNANLITYAKAIEIDGKKIAVLGSDIDFDKFKSDISTRKIYESGYFWIFNKNFDFIYHPTLTGKNLRDIEKEQNIEYNETLFSSNGTGLIEYIHEGENKILTYFRLSNGWYLCSVTPKDEIFTDLYQTLYINIIIIAIGLILSVIAAILIGKSISKPVSQLVKVIRKGISGDLSVRAHVKSNDEFTELANYFNYFMEQLEKNIDQLKNNERKLINARDKAEEADRLKSAFLANLSHEIRTPMNAIVGFTSLLQQIDLTEEFKEKYIGFVHKSTFELLDIINNIIDFSVLEANQVTPEYTTFSVNKFLETVQAHFNSELIKSRKENIDIQVIKSNNDLSVNSDKIRLHQILTYLLNNAIKFTDKGFIKLGYEVSDTKILFKVEDSGVGIAVEDMQQIFERFQKGKNTLNFPYRGTGLGLTISKRLIELLNGEIWIESIENEGTKVFFTIPNS